MTMVDAVGCFVVFGVMLLEYMHCLEQHVCFCGRTSLSLVSVSQFEKECQYLVLSMRQALRSEETRYHAHCIILSV